MEKDILGSIVEVEKEIQESIRIEKGKAQDRIEEVKKKAKEDVVQGEAELKDSCNDNLLRARAEARKRATHTIEKSAESAKRIEEIDDSVLRRILMKHIIRILPGES